MLFDLDWFKFITDRYGLTAGDGALRHAAQSSAMRRDRWTFCLSRRR
ncbi:GGDEF domain-containing protein (plasmid) [Aliirhizobium terrae]|nr:hypothetical protein [Rhizobium sp. CC-CFT758]WJH38871.1 GGDEF domain-containing protein [Rhizobium sp. CC-CFT758]